MNNETVIALTASVTKSNATHDHERKPHSCYVSSTFRLAQKLSLQDKGDCSTDPFPFVGYHYACTEGSVRKMCSHLHHLRVRRKIQAYHFRKMDSRNLKHSQSIAKIFSPSKDRSPTMFPTTIDHNVLKFGQRLLVQIQNTIITRAQGAIDTTFALQGPQQRLASPSTPSPA